MSPIVVGCTDTKAGRDAVATAGRIAQATDAALVLTIVLPSDTRSVITPPDAGYDNYLRMQAGRWLHAGAKAIPEGVAHTPEIRYGETIAEELVAAADEANAAAIVVGAADGGLRGRHRLGSTSTRLLYFSDVPVVLAPRGARKRGAAPISRVTVAIGTRPGADELLQEAVRLAGALRAPLRLLSLVTVDLPASVDTAAIRLAGDSHAAEVLAAARAHLPADLAVDVVIGSGASIEEAVRGVEWEDDEVVLVASSRLAQPRRLFLGSTAEKMLRELTVPMIVVPRTRRDSASDIGGSRGRMTP